MEGTQPFNSATDNFGHDCPFATRENNQTLALMSGLLGCAWRQLILRLLRCCIFFATIPILRSQLPTPAEDNRIPSVVRHGNLISTHSGRSRFSPCGAIYHTAFILAALASSLVHSWQI